MYVYVYVYMCINMHPWHSRLTANGEDAGRIDRGASKPKPLCIYIYIYIHIYI